MDVSGGGTIWGERMSLVAALPLDPADVGLFCPVGQVLYPTGISHLIEKP